MSEPSRHFTLSLNSSQKDLPMAARDQHLSPRSWQMRPAPNFDSALRTPKAIVYGFSRSRGLKSDHV